ncbi:hypothetical protein RSK20926_00045 [Roseobacter sp. SK209-2-6]|nr:hypothetical protein RSK20926_00045 [Roseobacter sp. SK209-2-6]
MPEAQLRHIFLRALQSGWSGGNRVFRPLSSARSQVFALFRSRLRPWGTVAPYFVDFPHLAFSGVPQAVKDPPCFPFLEPHFWSIL